MILDLHNRDILEARHPVIAFAINYEGFNDAGFAGIVARQFWPELENTGPVRPGEVRDQLVQIKGREVRMLAIPCHSLYQGKWDTDQITRALDTLAREELYVERTVEEAHNEPEELPGVVWMGRGFVGQVSGGPDLPALTMLAMTRSVCPVTVYYR